MRAPDLVSRFLAVVLSVPCSCASPSGASMSFTVTVSKLRSSAAPSFLTRGGRLLKRSQTPLSLIVVCPLLLFSRPSVERR